MREKLIKGGVRNLKQFGYPDVDEKNILTDGIYSAFFASMLDSNKGLDSAFDVAIDSLQKEIQANAKGGK